MSSADFNAMALSVNFWQKTSRGMISPTIMVQPGNILLLL
jgi:hypothetical protein